MSEKILFAEELHGQHLGREVEFGWHFPHSRVSATVIGELREVSHDGHDVTVWLTGQDAPAGAKTEFTLEPGRLVTFRAVD